MKKVLVTGASGFIGRHALPGLLARGYAVHALSRRAEPNEALAGVIWHTADALDIAATTALVTRIKPTHMLHFAWNAEHGVFWRTPDNLRWLAASLSLLRAFVEQGGQRFVGAGTCAEYDWSGDGICDEATTPLRPATLYGTSKKAMHDMLAAFAPGIGLSWAWGRIFFLFGPDEQPNRLVPHLIRNVLTGQSAVCRLGQLMRDFLPAAEVGDAFAALLDSNVNGAVNVASGQPRRLGDIARMIATACAGDVDVREDAPGNEPLRLVAATERLRREVRWTPSGDPAVALAETVAWWRAKLAADTG
jgi:nucleoside-diphosphate-sugar epimerase